MDYCLWESPDGRFAALLYDIAEVGVSKEAGRLALFQNKDTPEAALLPADLLCWYLYDSGAQFGPDGLVFVHRFQEAGDRQHVVVCALDVPARKFALVDRVPEDFYEVRHQAARRYSLRATRRDGTTRDFPVDLDRLDWRPLRDWSDFHPDAPRALRLLRAPGRLLAAFSALKERGGHGTALRNWELLLALIVPSLATLCLILVLALPSFFLPDYQDVGPPLGTTHFANHLRLAVRFIPPPLAAYAFWMWRLCMKRERLPEVFWGFLGWMFLVLSLFVPVSYEVLNVALDRDSPQAFRAAVAAKYVESGTVGTEFTSSITTYVLKFPSWRKDRDWQLVAVRKTEYEGVVPARTEVTLRIKPGHFGQPWLQSYEIHP